LICRKAVHPGFTALAAVAALLAAAPGAGAQDTRGKQEIVFPELPARTDGDAAFEVAVKSTSGLPVSLEVVSGPAVLDGKRLRLTGGPGIVIIRASQAGSGDYLPAHAAERAFTVNPKPFAPVFRSQPAGVRVAIGDAIELSADAAGEPRPAFQWRKDGEPITGASDSRLVIAPAALSDAGDYDIVASNSLGSAASGRARVSVVKRGQTINFLGQQAAVVGQAVELSANATSGLPVHFDLVSGSAVLSGAALTAQWAGTVVVRASQQGDATYEAAPPETQTFVFVAASSGQHGP
jgi:hypothetical protein